MLRLGKLTDYAIVLLGMLAAEGTALPATVLAEKSRLPKPTVAKVLKTLHKSGLVEATRGVTGGYKLRQNAQEIPLSAIIEALEGPIALTACVPESTHPCAHAVNCHHSGRWAKVNRAVKSALSAVNLADMLEHHP